MHTTVAIAVCTAQRSRMLCDCLEAIRKQMIPEHNDVCLIVADNDAEPTAWGSIEAFAARCPFPVHYVHEPRRGVSHARNAVLREAKRLAVAWIAMTDDDCRPEPTWLTALLQAAKRHEADVVYGRREFIIPAPQPYWILGPEKENHYEGQELDYAPTHNVLFAARLTKLQFDERLAHGADLDFFYRAKTHHGARIFYSPAAIVHEEMGRQRATLWYQSKRRYYYAAAWTHFVKRHHGVRAALASALKRYVRAAPTAMVKLTIAPLLWPFSADGFKRRVLRSLGRLTAAAGAIAGLAGRDGNPYSKITDALELPLPSAQICRRVGGSSNNGAEL